MVKQTQLVREAQMKVLPGKHKDGVKWSHACVRGRKFCVRHRDMTTETWDVQEEISRGSFGKVTKERFVVKKRTGGLRAVKTFERRENSKSIDYNRELNAIFEFSQEKYQPYFVKAYGWFMPEATNIVCIAMECIEQGNLKQLLGELNRDDVPEDGLREEVARGITQQLLKGLSFMHESGYAHRDLKPANILVESLRPCVWVKIADFGLSTRLEDKAEDSTMRCPWGYQSPEVDGFEVRLKKEGNITDDRPRDIWAVGEICFQLLSKRPAFSDLKTRVQYIQESLLPTGLVILPSIGYIPKSAQGFVHRAMDVHPQSRITAQKGLNDDWIQTSIQDPKRVFGVPLSDLMTYAATGGKLVVSAEEPFEQRVGACTLLLPILFAECGEFLIREARRRMSVSAIHVFTYELAQDSKSDDRITELKKAFDCSPRFGRSPEWNNTTIRDVLELLCGFIEELPKPIIAPTDPEELWIITSAHPNHELEIYRYCLRLIHYLSPPLRSHLSKDRGPRKYDDELLDMFGSILLQPRKVNHQDEKIKKEKRIILKRLLNYKSFW